MFFIGDMSVVELTQFSTYLFTIKQVHVSTMTGVEEMNITILSVGKLKEKYLKDGISEYEKRLNRYCSIKLIEVADDKAPENLSESDLEQVKKREGARILKQAKEGTYMLALDLQGQMHSSEKFAEKLESLSLNGCSHVTFVIGGSLGLSENVLQAADEKVSFSPMTFPHQLMRLILLEQIYRGFRITRNEPYHK